MFDYIIFDPFKIIYLFLQPFKAYYVLFQVQKKK